MYNSSSFFTIGKSHIVCQDYALNVNAECPILICTDGCSSSNSKHVDVGARILAHMALKTFYHNPASIQSWLEDLAYNSLVESDKLGLDIQDLFATLLVAFVINDQAHVWMFGDGACFFKKKNGELEIITVDYSGNAPYYPIYGYTVQMQNQYFNSKTKEGILFGTATIDNGIERVTQEKCIYHTVVRDISDLQLFGVMSDGVSSGLCNSVEPVPIRQVITDLTAVKNYNGQFAVRRVNKFLQDSRRKNIEFHDDISVGMISIGEPQ